MATLWVAPFADVAATPSVAFDVACDSKESMVENGLLVSRSVSTVSRVVNGLAVAGPSKLVSGPGLAAAETVLSGVG